MPYYIQVDSGNIVTSTLMTSEGTVWDISGLPNVFQTSNYESEAGGKRLVGWSETDPMQPLFEDVQLAE